MRTQTYYNAPSEKEADICSHFAGLMINCAGAVETADGISNLSVRKDFYLMYILDGRMPITINGQLRLICKGNLLIIAPGTKYHYQSECGSKLSYLWIHFTGRDAEEILEHFKIPVNSVLNPEVHNSMQEKWYRLFKEFITNDEYFYDVSSGVFKEILASFSRYISNKNINKMLYRSIIYIHEHYFENISVAKLAETENLSETHYRLCFRRITGTSPSKYIIGRRMEAAVALLEDSEKSLSEIAKAVGYEDVYYFGRIFKKEIGISPGRFRNKQRYK